MTWYCPHKIRYGFKLAFDVLGSISGVFCRYQGCHAWIDCYWNTSLNPEGSVSVSLSA